MNHFWITQSWEVKKVGAEHIETASGLLCSQGQPSNANFSEFLFQKIVLEKLERNVMPTQIPTQFFGSSNGHIMSPKRLWANCAMYLCMPQWSLLKLSHSAFTFGCLVANKTSKDYHGHCDSTSSSNNCVCSKGREYWYAWLNVTPYTLTAYMCEIHSIPCWRYEWSTLFLGVVACRL